MRKRLGIFVGEIAQDYQKIVAKETAKRANPLGYDCVFICSYGSYNEDIMYSEGEKACIYLPDCSTFDGIIVAEDVFDIAGMPDALYDILQRDANCPIVYLRTTRDGCYSVLTENKHSIESAVRHFTDVHGFTDICYMSGKKDAEDAQERLAGYMAVMEEKGIEVTEHMVFHGDYWRNKGGEAIDWFMEGRTDYPQAIVCANDYMALSICEELRKRNVKIPQEVCVSGYDFIDEARANTPTLTSLEVDFEKMIERAVDIIHQANSGNKPEQINNVEAKLRLHKSCGCGEQYQFENVAGIIEREYKHIDDTKNSFISVTDYQDSFEFEEYMSVADKYRRFIRTQRAYYCFCDSSESGSGAVENDSMFTNKMILRRSFYKDEPVEKHYITFPRRKILPDELWKKDEPNNFCVFAIHFKNIVYGYIVAEMPEDNWFDIYTQGYIMTLSNAIANSDVHYKMEKLETIRAIYQKDELTGILNRRGFDKLLQERYTKVKADGHVIGIVSIDMDNLKIINDTFGHAEGDRSLTTLAKCLDSVMKQGDFCARIGGDEFAAVIDVCYAGRCNEFKKELNDALKRESSFIDDYDVEASIGYCQSNEHEAVSLVAMIQAADKRMYEDKRRRKNDNIR